jgi:hypothetical protein
MKFGEIEPNLELCIPKFMRILPWVNTKILEP